MLDLIGFWVSVSLITLFMVLPIICTLEMIGCFELKRLTNGRFEPEPPLSSFIIGDILMPMEFIGVVILLSSCVSTFFGICLMIEGTLITTVSGWSVALAPYTWWLIIPIGYIMIANKVIKPMVLKVLNLNDKINKL